MKKTSGNLYLQDILLSLSNVADLMNLALNEHHQRVAYIAYCIANACDCNLVTIQNIVLAALLHDIGAFSEQERLSLLAFEDNAYSQVDLHAEVGYRLLRDFGPFATAATYIRYHHKPWISITGQSSQELDIPIESHIIHLADRIAVLINKNQDILRQSREIGNRISNSGSLFMPELVEVFLKIAVKEEFWLNVFYEPINETFYDGIGLAPIPFNSTQFESLLNLFRRIIDFRSAFTSVHSCGVASTARVIASVAGFSPQELYMIKCAGELHDLGKIAIPSEILEKPAPLTPGETSIMRTHPYHTNRILRPLPFFDHIRLWASQHHERIDGSGYPFHTNGRSLSLGSRIIMAADVFTALTEDRPYRKGMLLGDALDVMKYMVGNSMLDREVYEWTRAHAAEIDYSRIVSQDLSKVEYQKFIGTVVDPV